MILTKPAEEICFWKTVTFESAWDGMEIGKI